MKIMSRRRSMGLLATFGLAGVIAESLGVAGCSALPAIQSALQIATEAVIGIEATIGAIETFADGYFVLHPNPAEQTKVDDALIRVRQLLVVVIDVLKAAKDITELAVAQAMADLQAAYNDLLALTKPINVTSSPRMPTGVTMMATDRSSLVVPQTLSLQ